MTTWRRQSWARGLGRGASIPRRPLAALGVPRIFAPGSYWSMVMLDFPVSLGEYRCPRDPREAAVVFLVRAPCRPGLPPKEPHRAELLGTRFESSEGGIRGPVGRTLGPGGLVPERDVLAITVNRWPHRTVRGRIG